MSARSATKNPSSCFGKLNSPNQNDEANSESIREQAGPVTRYVHSVHATLPWLIPVSRPIQRAMLHWYRLARLRREERSHMSGEHSHLIATHRGSPTASLSAQQRQKLFWLGLAEAVPLFVGGVFSVYTDSKLHAVTAALVAMVVTAIVCWLLRHQVPLTRIELSTPRPDRPLERL